MTTIVLVVALTLLCVAAGFALCLWYLRTRTGPELKTQGRQCDVCGELLERTAMRTHFGAWRCRRHKGDAA